MKKIEQFQGEYRWLSNFYDVDIEFRGNTFKSIEHAYCSAKNSSQEWLNICLDYNNSPGKIKRLGKDIELVDDWVNLKDDVMFELLKIKFNKEPFKSKLIDTNGLVIEEGNLWGDKYYGICLKTGEGQNKLGKMIMKIRNAVIIESNHRK